MSNQYLSPCRTEKICNGCTVKRSCATKTGLPNCIKQFMDGLDIKEAVLKSCGAPAEQTGNTGSPKLRENIMERLDAVSCIIGGTLVPSREELDCAVEELDNCIAQLRAGA